MFLLNVLLHSFPAHFRLFLNSQQPFPTFTNHRSLPILLNKISIDPSQLLPILPNPFQCFIFLNFYFPTKITNHKGSSKSMLKSMLGLKYPRQRMVSKLSLSICPYILEFASFPRQCLTPSNINNSINIQKKFKIELI